MTWAEPPNPEGSSPATQPPSGGSTHGTQHTCQASQLARDHPRQRRKGRLIGCQMAGAGGLIRNSMVQPSGAHLGREAGVQGREGAGVLHPPQFEQQLRLARLQPAGWVGADGDSSSSRSRGGIAGSRALLGGWVE